MSNFVNDVFEGAVQSAVAELDRDTRGEISSVAREILGFRVNHWGEITWINPQLIDRIRAKIPQEKIDEFEQRLLAKLEDRISEKFIGSMVKKIVESIEYDVFRKVTDRIHGEVENRIFEAASAQIETKLIERFPELFVAKRLIEANSNKE
jgi:hypothetical protein